jgi:hypothetical protein
MFALRDLRHRLHRPLKGLRFPRRDGLALRTVRHGITDGQGIGRCGKCELNIIPRIGITLNPVPLKAQPRSAVHTTPERVKTPIRVARVAVQPLMGVA